MSLQSDVTAEIARIFREAWTTRDGNVVPESTDVQLGNDAVELDGTVLYADLRESTNMVDSHAATFAAEVYKAYLHCAAKVVSSEGGEITAYDGDRLMAVYIGDRKNTSAVRSALKLNYAVDEIINPLLRAQYPNTSFCLKHCVGVDTSSLFVARTGIRGSNDLVWVGRAANHAAKMTSLTGLPAWISEDVYDHMNDAVKMSQKGEAMWTKRLWTAMAQKPVYASSWRWGGL